MMLKWKERNQQSDPLAAGVRLSEFQQIQIERYTANPTEKKEGAGDYIYVVRINGLMLPGRPFTELEDAKQAGTQALIKSINAAYVALQKVTG